MISKVANICFDVSRAFVLHGERPLVARSWRARACSSLSLFFLPEIPSHAQPLVSLNVLLRRRWLLR